MRILDRIRSAVAPTPSTAAEAPRPDRLEAEPPASGDTPPTSREEASPATVAGPDAVGSSAHDLDSPLEREMSSPRIRLTPAALDKVREMLQDEELLEEGGLRLTARHGAGCSAPLQFGMVMEVEAQPEDEVLEGNGIRIFIDRKSSWSLDGLMIDYVDSPTMGAGFAFRHPRGAGGRSC